MSPIYIDNKNNTNYQQINQNNRVINFTNNNSTITNTPTASQRIRLSRPSRPPENTLPNTNQNIRLNRPSRSLENILPNTKNRNPIFKFLNPKEKTLLALTCTTIAKSISQPFFINQLAVNWKNNPLFLCTPDNKSFWEKNIDKESDYKYREFLENKIRIYNHESLNEVYRMTASFPKNVYTDILYNIQNIHNRYNNGYNLTSYGFKEDGDELMKQMACNLKTSQEEFKVTYIGENNEDDLLDSLLPEYNIAKKERKDFSEKIFLGFSKNLVKFNIHLDQLVKQGLQLSNISLSYIEGTNLSYGKVEFHTQKNDTDNNFSIIYIGFIRLNSKKDGNLPIHGFCIVSSPENSSCYIKNEIFRAIAIYERKQINESLNKDIIESPIHSNSFYYKKVINKDYLINVGKNNSLEEPINNLKNIKLNRPYMGGCLVRTLPANLTKNNICTLREYIPAGFINGIAIADNERNKNIHHGDLILNKNGFLNGDFLLDSNNNLINAKTIYLKTDKGNMFYGKFQIKENSLACPNASIAITNEFQTYYAGKINLDLPKINPDENITINGRMNIIIRPPLDSSNYNIVLAGKGIRVKNNIPNINDANIFYKVRSIEDNITDLVIDRNGKFQSYNGIEEIIFRNNAKLYRQEDGYLSINHQLKIISLGHSEYLSPCGKSCSGSIRCNPEGKLIGNSQVVSINTGEIAIEGNLKITNDLKIIEGKASEIDFLSHDKYYKFTGEILLQNNKISKGKLSKYIDNYGNIFTSENTLLTVNEEGEFTGGIANKVVTVISDTKFIYTGNFEIGEDGLIKKGLADSLHCGDNCWYKGAITIGLEGHPIEGKVWEYSVSDNIYRSYYEHNSENKADNAFTIISFKNNIMMLSGIIRQQVLPNGNTTTY